MALYQLHFLSPSASFNFPFSSKPKKWNLKRNFHQNPVYGVVISASSAEKPSRKKKGRPSRAVMSDEDLCKQLREVMSVAGLPADQVPQVKELCEHGSCWLLISCPVAIVELCRQESYSYFQREKGPLLLVNPVGSCYSSSFWFSGVLPLLNVLLARYCMLYC